MMFESINEITLKIEFFLPKVPIWNLFKIQKIFELLTSMKNRYVFSPTTGPYDCLHKSEENA